MGIEISGVLGLIWLFIVIWAIIRTAQSPAGPVVKALWIVILLVVPVIGLIAWLLLGPK
ncbi:PLDc N-terminal domain-containing protein [Aquisalimonas lutea]|uniref:PLDc N-terminal domain-containing protein n=1 Tax=Aquisalimonas lutea TaxID=1327750 RepID=UPI0025B41D11|nr:PLDc N-terminal domain-containing protein [Aquisalimonas lutea]MDN3518875.1 PLDc N-terminal domain-containing protein [Aquisalimonas lutea]